jgi:hypothetical protein
MSTLREAAQQALEALEFMADEWGFTQKANRPERWQAIEALRAALTQQEQEPVARMHADGSGRIISQATYDEAQRQGGAPWSSVRGYTTPLYTRPPRREWQSLSEEESNELSHMMVKGHKSVNWLARAIETKLKEKNA